jgi:hypothetical protein
MYAGHFAAGLAMKAQAPRWPIGWWWFELAFVACCLAFYVLRARPGDRFGGRALWAAAVVLVLHAANSPWLSPAS